MEFIPAPVYITPKEEEKEEKILNTKTFEIESNKKNKYEIKLSKAETKIIIEGKQKKQSKQIIYYLKQSTEEIKNNKYFLMFDNLDEIYEEIINLLQNNKPYLIEETNSAIITIPVSTTKIKEIKFCLDKKEKSDKEKIEDVYSIVDDMKSYYDGKISELMNAIQQQGNQIKELIEITQQQKNKINELNEKIEKIEEKKDIFGDSVIINKNGKYISYLKKWISEREGKFKTKLLFRKSINGNSFTDFHRLCDNQGKTLVLIQTEDGLLLGGYTTKDWNVSSGWMKDDNSFLFSLTYEKIFPNKKNRNESIMGSKGYGPWFAYIGSGNGKDLTQGYFYYRFKSSESFENYNDIMPNKKDTSFDIKEIEVYKIF